ncbi:MAG: DUF3179 domain-containing protein [Candidatus Brocadia sp.]
MMLTVCSVVFSISLGKVCFAGRPERIEIKSVLPRDAIPAIKSPEFVPASGAGLDRDEPVIGVSVNGESHAYSVYLLNNHEIVNDTIGGNAFAVAWCPLANLAVVYSREIDDKVYTFGVSGKLLKNTLVMFDYETGSLWPIVYGSALDGKLSGNKLKILMSQKMPWGAWKELHPNTLVLSYRGQRTVGFDTYNAYHKSEKTGILPVKNVDERLRAKMNVIGIEVNGRYKAYPFSIFDNKKIITDDFQGQHLLIYRDKETNSIMVYNRQINGHVIDFEESPTQGVATDNVTKTAWDLENGIGIEGSMKGKLLQRGNFISVYWFVLADYYPETDIYP